MLRVLRIQDLAVVPTLEIEFDTGFNVITGETGAGKSILIKALGLLMGAKASADAIRTDAKAARLEAEFWPSESHSALPILEQLGIDFDPSEPQILVRRVVSASGRSQAWINDVAVTLSSLRSVGELLLDVFAQHENHRLLDPNSHLQYLDSFLPKKNHRDQVAGSYRDLREQLRAVVKKIELFKQKTRERDYLEYRWREIDTLSPSKDDYEKLIAQSDDLAVLAKSQAVLGEAQERLDGNGGVSSGLCQETAALIRLLRNGGGEHPQLRSIVEELDAVANVLGEASFTVSRLLDEASGSETNQDDLEARLSAYQDLMRKLGVDEIDSLEVEVTRLREELSFLESAAFEVKSQLAVVHKTATKLGELTTKLSQERKKAAAAVKSMVESELRELAMPGARLDIALSSFEQSIQAIDVSAFDGDCVKLWEEIAAVLVETSEHGAERAQILLASNPGEKARALQKVASGGEISRIMLAFKRALAAGADTCVLVFDEIDTGISGMIADVVGRKLRELSKNFQVICISHLAQVASYGDSHFLVRKFQRKGRTESEIVCLDAKESTREIARMLSGEKVTSSSLANATELKKRASLLS